LVPLGCCGSWLLILSLLPSVVGTSVSAALIQYSIPLSYVGLAIVAGFTALTAAKLRKELKLRQSSISKFKEENR
jgi:membrane protein implicated in regulation of membrane protease activity